MIVTVTEENFSQVIHSSPVVILHFWSDFCAPCKMSSTILERIEQKNPEEIVIGEINSTHHPDWLEAFSIYSTPTSILFSNGKYKSRMSGANPESIVESWIETNITH